jgi:hypothetical protein
MKQTAVNWLVNELVKKGFPIGKYGMDLYEQAKEIEKQQIIDACNQTEFEDIDGMGIHETITKGEQYYNETFKNK